MIFKDNVVLNVQPEIARILPLIDQVHEEMDTHEAVITSANDSTHMDGSLHPKGLAIDIRTRDIDPELVTELAKALKLKLNGSVLINRPYQVIIEIDHIHIEFDPK